MRDWFADPGNASLAAVAVAMLSLVGSAAAFVLSWRTSRRQTAIMEAQERDRQRAGKRAALRARLEREGCMDALVVENVGAVEARNIVIDSSQRLAPRAERPTTLAPNACWRCLLPNSIPGGPIPSVGVRLTWEDDSGESGLWESHVSHSS